MLALLTVVIAAAPATTVRASDIFFAAGESLGAVGGQRWVDQPATAGRVSSLFTRFQLDVVEVPMLGPLTAMLLESQAQHDGWQGRMLINFTSLGMQSVGAGLAILEVFEGAPVEGAVETFRPTRVSFRLVEGGGVVTIAGVTY